MDKDIFGNMNLGDIDNMLDELSQYDKFNIEQADTDFFEDFSEPDYENLDFDVFAEKEKNTSASKPKKNKTQNKENKDVNNKKNDKSNNKSASDMLFDSIGRTDYGDKDFISQFNNKSSEKPSKKKKHSPATAPNTTKTKQNKDTHVETGEVEDEEFIFTIKTNNNDEDDNVIDVTNTVTISNVEEPTPATRTEGKEKKDNSSKSDILTNKNTENKVKKPVEKKTNGNASASTLDNKKGNDDKPENKQAVIKQTDEQATQKEIKQEQSSFTAPKKQEEKNNIAPTNTPNSVLNSERSEKNDKSYTVNEEKPYIATNYAEYSNVNNNGYDTGENTINENTDTLKPPKENLFLKKGLVVGIAFLIMIVFPISLTLMFGKKSDNKDNDKKTKTKVTTELVTEFSSNNENGTTVTTASSVFQEAGDYAYQSLEDTDNSGRFETLDDLTLYISGQSMSCLSAEKQAETKYNNGNMSYNELKEVVDYNSDVADNLYHLLIVNKNVYISEGKEDVYNGLAEDINNLIVYGDTLLLNAK